MINKLMLEVYNILNYHVYFETLYVTKIIIHNPDTVFDAASDERTNVQSVLCSTNLV